MEGGGSEAPFGGGPFGGGEGGWGGGGRVCPAINAALTIPDPITWCAISTGHL